MNELSRVDALLGGETDAWRFWCPPVLDLYGENDLLLCLDDVAAPGVRHTGRGARARNQLSRGSNRVLTSLQVPAPVQAEDVVMLDGS